MNNSNYIREVLFNSPANNNDYSAKLELFKSLKSISFTSPVTILVGENGTGKSTIIEAIALKYGLNLQGGGKNYNYNNTVKHSDLYKQIDIVKGFEIPKHSFFLRAQTFYNFAVGSDQLNAEYNPQNNLLQNNSHGESFLSLITTRFKPNGLYLLDEPEAALSPDSQLKLLAIMHKLVKQKCQFIMCTHSPILLAFPQATILELLNNEVNQVSYEQTNHYMLYKYFISNYTKVLKDILD